MNGKTSPLLILALLSLIVIATGSARFISLQFLVPGPEGPACSVYGVQHTSRFSSDTRLHLVSETPTGTIISQSQEEWADFYTQLLMAKPDPYNTVVQKDWLWLDTEIRFNSLNFLVEVSRPTVEDIDKHGDPLAIRTATDIVWKGWSTQPVESGNQISWTQYGAYLVPVDVKIQVSCRAAMAKSYEYVEDLNVWLVFNTVRWYNAFALDGQLIDAETPEDAILQSYEYKGAFPIFAWMSEWDPVVVENESGEEYEDIPSEINDLTQIYPSMEGRQIPLYTSPDTQYQEILSSNVWKDPSLITGLENKPNIPDPRFAETVFTPITLTKYGALKQSSGWGPFYEEKLYYPTSSIRIRLLYLVWGRWNYLWTQEEAEEKGYEWEERTTIIHVHESAWNQFWGGLGAWWWDVITSPFTYLWTFIGFLFLGLITLIIISIFAPGLLGLFSRKQRRGGG